MPSKGVPRRSSPTVPERFDYRFDAEVWMHDGPAAWHFVTLPPEIADEIEERSAAARRGFGSVPVEVTIGTTTWRTSLFPDRKRASYVLPLKQAVRTAERLGDGTPCTVALVLSTEAPSP